MRGKEFLKEIWDLKQVNRPGFVLEEPAFRFGSLDVTKSNEEIFENRYQKYLALREGRTDNVGSLDCILGTHILPCLFGCRETVLPDGQRFIEKPVIYSAKDVEHLKPADIMDGVVGRQIELLEYFADRTHGEIPIRVGDIQNPLGILNMMWETSDFFISLFEEDPAVHTALDIVTDVLTEYLHKMLDIGDFVIPVCWPFIWVPQEKGVYLADDTMSLISPEMYEEYGVTYNNRISDEFGGIMLHSCSTKEKYFDSIMKNKNLRSINFAAQYSSDMDTIFRYFGGKVVILPHYCHTDNPQIGTPEEFMEIVMNSWTPETPTIIYMMENANSLKQQSVFDTYSKRFSIV